MARIVIQAGHCHRKTGSTGTRSADGFTEQQFTWPTSNRAAELLRADGHDARVILADPTSGPNYRGDVFVAIHADGNNNPAVHGASVGYRTDEGKALAAAWKAAYRALGWPGGFRNDNYTAALGGYYGTKAAVAQGCRRAVIIEAGFLTNPAEADELSGQVGQFRCAQAIRRAANAVLGHAPEPPTPPQEDLFMLDTHEARDAFVRNAYRKLRGKNGSDAEVAFWVWVIAGDRANALNLIIDLTVETRRAS